MAPVSSLAALAASTAAHQSAGGIAGAAAEPSQEHQAQSPCLSRICCPSIPEGARMGLHSPAHSSGREGCAAEGTSPSSQEWEQEPAGCFQAWLLSGNAGGQSSVPMSRPRTSRGGAAQKPTQRIPEVGKDLKDHQVQFLKSLPCFPPSAYSHLLPTSPRLAGSAPASLSVGAGS